MKDIYKDVASTSNKILEKGLDKVKDIATSLNKVAVKAVDKYQELSSALKNVINDVVSEDEKYYKCLTFELTEDNRGYSVKKVNANLVVDGKVVVPEIYNGLPVIKIGIQAFSHAYTIDNALVLPDTIEVIDKCAFSSMSRLKTIRIPKSVHTIEDGAFFASEFTWISVDEENERFCSLDGNIFTKDKNELIAYAIGKEEDVYYIPDEVSVLRDLSFYRCSLKKVVFNDNLLVIKRSAFSESKLLEELNLPPFLQEIGDHAFAGVENVKKIVIPATVGYIGNEAFYSFDKSEISFEKPTDFLLVYAYQEKKSNKKIRKSALKNSKKATKFLAEKFSLYDWTAIRKSDKKVKE